MKKYLSTSKIAYAFILSSLQANTYAAQTGDSVEFKFNGTFIISISCSINNDKTISVPFGNVGIKKVDGTHYEMPIPFSANCEGAADSDSVRFTISGVPENFDNAAVTTNVSGLGIQIRSNGTPVQLNKTINTTLGALSTLSLTAVPVKDPTIELSEQSFTATAMITAEYL